MHLKSPISADRHFLSRFQEYGVLSEEHVRDTLVVARTSLYGQTALAQSQLTRIGANLAQTMVTVNAGLGAAKSESKLESLVLPLEGLVDAGDAVRRRRVANQIYKDLIAARISHSRAAIELLKLTQQQKGGWLYDKLRIRMMMLVDSDQCQSQSQSMSTQCGDRQNKRGNCVAQYPNMH